MKQIKLVIWGSAIVLLGLIGGTGWLIYERIEGTVAPKDTATRKDVQRIEAEQLQQKKRMGEAEQRLTALENDLSDYKSRNDKRVGELEGRVSSGEKKVSDLEKRASDLEKRSDKSEDEVKQVQADLAQARKDLEDAKKERDQMRSEMNRMQADIDEIKKALGIKPNN